MPEPDKLEIEFYIPTRYADKSKIPKGEIECLIRDIQQHYNGSTITKGKGYYQSASGEDHYEKVLVLSVVTSYGRAKKQGIDVSKIKEMIKTHLKQDAVLITHHLVAPSCQPGRNFA